MINEAGYTPEELLGEHLGETPDAQINNLKNWLEEQPEARDRQPVDPSTEIKYDFGKSKPGYIPEPGTFVMVPGTDCREILVLRNDDRISSLYAPISKYSFPCLPGEVKVNDSTVVCLAEATFIPNELLTNWVELRPPEECAIDVEPGELAIGVLTLMAKTEVQPALRNRVGPHIYKASDPRRIHEEELSRVFAPLRTLIDKFWECHDYVEEDGIERAEYTG